MGSLFATVLLDVLPITPLGGTFFWMTHNWGGATPPGVARELPDVPEILFSCNRHAPGFPSGLAVDEVSR